MNRRDFLRSAGAVSAGLAFTKAGRLIAMDVASANWRTFEVTTRVEVMKSSGVTLVWLPAALIRQQKTLSNKFSAEGGTAEFIESRADAVGIIAAKFPSGVRPVLSLTSWIATKDCAIDFSEPSRAPTTDRAGAGAFPALDETLAHRCHRERESGADYKGRENRCRESPRDLRVDRGQHVSEPPNARLRHRRHPLHAGVWGCGRQVRRSQRALRGPRPGRAFRHATCMASASPNRTWDTRASAPRRRT